MARLHAHLEKRDPTNNEYRFYALHVVPTLFGGWSLVREWGQIGSPGRVVVETFETREAGEQALAERMHEKLKKGYEAVGAL